MSDEGPGNKNPEVKPARDENGRLLPGHTANPGGASGEIRKFRELLKDLHPLTVKVARKALNRAQNTGRLQEIVEGEGVEDKDRLEAESQINARMKVAGQFLAEIWKYSVTKPTQKHKVTGKMENPLAGMTTEQLLEWGRSLKDSPKESK